MFRAIKEHSTGGINFGAHALNSDLSMHSAIVKTFLCSVDRRFWRKTES